jgi:ubiquitin-protein ligase
MPPNTATVAAAALLARQLKEMQTGKDIPGISVGLVSDSNIFEWEVMLMINDDCRFYGGASPLALSQVSHSATVANPTQEGTFALA